MHQIFDQKNSKDFVFIELQWLESYWHFCDFLLHKSWKTDPGPMLPPGAGSVL